MFDLLRCCIYLRFQELSCEQHGIFAPATFKLCNQRTISTVQSSGVKREKIAADGSDKNLKM